MRILIVKMSSLGDIIHAFSVVEYLKQCYSEAQIDWVVEQPFADLVQAHPLLNRVLCVKTKQWRSHPLCKQTRQEIVNFRSELRKTSYDIVFDLQGNIKSSFVTASAKSPLKIGFGCATVPEWPNLLATNKRFNPPQEQNIREDYLFLAQSALANFTPIREFGVKLMLKPQEQEQLESIVESISKVKKLKIMVCPGSNWANKQLSKETLLSFLQNIDKKLTPHFILVWGNQSEKELTDDLSASFPQQSVVINRLSLPGLQNLMTHVDLVIAMDSLPLHLAGTTSTPTYSVFGASSCQKYKPLGEQHEAYQGTCPYGKSFIKRCDVLRTCKTGACIKNLEGQRLFDHFFNWFNRN